jgi:hypothetical protein
LYDQAIEYLIVKGIMIPDHSSPVRSQAAPVRQPGPSPIPAHGRQVGQPNPNSGNGRYSSDS